MHFGEGESRHGLATSRTQVNRLLDPKNDITLSTCSVRRRSSDGGHDRVGSKAGHAGNTGM
jgi:hypothetical protein